MGAQSTGPDSKAKQANATARAQVEAPIGEVKCLGNSGLSRRLWVRCERLEDTVPVERCLVCPRRTGVSVHANGQPKAIQCEVEQVPPLAPRRTTAEVKLPRRSVGDLMTRHLLCLSPDLSLDAGLLAVVEQGHSALPVTSRDGELLGLLTEADATLHLQLEGGGGSVADVMQPLRCAVLESVPATQAAGILAQERMERLLVVNAQEQVVGILSASDLLAWMARADGYAMVPL